MRFILPILSLFLLAGCSPQADVGLYGTPVSNRDADRQYKARLLNLVDDKSTRAEVLAVMGDPDQVDEAFRVLMYYWTVKERDSENIVRSFVVVQFDEKDVLTRHKQADYAAEFGGPKLPEEVLNDFLGAPAR
jgi:outer membrane protein assembly factor BamE (lipoprotein component of BamABCDE complex)